MTRPVVAGGAGFFVFSTALVDRRASAPGRMRPQANRSNGSARDKLNVELQGTCAALKN